MIFDLGNFFFEVLLYGMISKGYPCFVGPQLNWAGEQDIAISQLRCTLLYQPEKLILAAVISPTRIGKRGEICGRKATGPTCEYGGWLSCLDAAVSGIQSFAPTDLL